MRDDTFPLRGLGSLSLCVCEPSHCSPSLKSYPRESFDMGKCSFMVKNGLLIFEVEAEDIHERGEQRFEIFSIGLIGSQTRLDCRFRLRNKAVAIDQQLLL